MQRAAKKFVVIENEHVEENTVEQESAASVEETVEAAVEQDNETASAPEAVADSDVTIAQDNGANDADAADGEGAAAELQTGDTDATQPAARPDEFRLIEALLFASKEPLDEAALAKRLPEGANIKETMRALQAEYSSRGVNLVKIGKKWAFRTAGDLSWLLTKNVVQSRKLSRAAIETLAIIAYHQPVTRAEVEEIRGVAAAKGTLDVLLETGWIRPRGRRKVPGRPITYGTSDAFLSHFGLEAVDSLPGLDELKGAGLLDGRLPPGFAVPVPNDDSTLRDDEDPLEPGDLVDLGLAPPPERVDDK
jgi:segregation and condensation protein B